MQDRLLLALMLIGAAVLSGCASYSSVTPGRWTMTEVRARLGNPTDIRFSGNGDEVWEYATGPSGRFTYILRFGRDYVVREVKQVLTEDAVAQIKPQMTKREVRELLGRPSDVLFLGGEPVWDWRLDAKTTGGATLSVRFDRDGTVKDVLMLLDPSDGNGKDAPDTAGGK
ncbi:MAG: outer membrane protein assembly factor BamE [Betaproteobacteria bacterium]|nr:outer membrane protein assembly factor BamE [Betaproteobacteria bacterium]